MADALLFGRDTLLFAHVILGLSIIVFSIVILLELNKKSQLLKILAILTAFVSWIILIPAGQLYLIFYPATKTLIKAGAWPWAHAVIMETKEHWGLFLPILATVAAGLVLAGKEKESKKWWILVIIVTVLIGIMGRIIKIGAAQ